MVDDDAETCADSLDEEAAAAKMEKLLNRPAPFGKLRAQAYIQLLKRAAEENEEK